MSLYPDTHISKSELVQSLAAFVKTNYLEKPRTDPASDVDAIVKRDAARLHTSWSSHALLDMWMEVRTPGNHDSMEKRERAFAKLVLDQSFKGVMAGMEQIKDDSFRMRTTGLPADRAHALWLSANQYEDFHRAFHAEAVKVIGAKYPGIVDEAQKVPPKQSASDVRGVLVDREGTPHVLSTVESAVKAIEKGEMPHVYHFDAQPLAAALAEKGITEGEWVVFAQSKRGDRTREMHNLDSDKPVVISGWGDWKDDAITPKNVEPEAVEKKRSPRP